MLSGVSLVGEKGECLPYSLLKLEKECPDFTKMVPWFWKKKSAICVHLCVKFSLTMQFKDHLGHRTPSFPCGAFILYVIHETFIKLSQFQETSLVPKKFLVARLLIQDLDYFCCIWSLLWSLFLQIYEFSIWQSLLSLKVFPLHMHFSVLFYMYIYLELDKS